MYGSTGRLGLALFLGLAVLSTPHGLATSARGQEAASAMQDVELDNVLLTFGNVAVTIPKLTVSGTRMSKESLLATLRSDDKEGWATRLQRLDAGSMSAPEIRVDQVDGSSKQSANYRDVIAKGVHGGKVASFSAAGAAVKVEGSAHPGTGTYGAIRSEDVDLAGISRLYAEAGDDKSPMLRVYGSFSIDEIAFSDAESVVAIGRLSGRDFAGRPVPTTWSGAAAALGALNGNGSDTAARARAGATAAELLGAFTVGNLEISRLSVKALKEEKAELSASRIIYASTGLDQGLTLSDLSFGADGVRAKIAGLRVTGFSLEPTIATLKRIGKAPETSEAEMRRLTPTIGTVTLSGIGIEVPQDASEPSEPETEEKAGPAAEPMRLGMRDASMTFGPPKDGVPTSGRLSVSGLTLPATALASFLGLESLEAYGYRDLDLSFVADTVWNEQSKELAVKEVSLSGKDMGTLRLNATLGGISPDLLDPSGVAAGFALLSATAKALDVSVENGGLFERFIAAQAKSLSLEPEELRKEYVTASVVGVPVVLGNSSAAKAIGAAMGEFVSKPGILSITARPKNGAGIGVLDFSGASTPGAVLDKLDVTAKAQ